MHEQVVVQHVETENTQQQHEQVVVVIVQHEVIVQVER
jgi:hypothetical protein